MTYGIDQSHTYRLIWQSLKSTIYAYIIYLKFISEIFVYFQNYFSPSSSEKSRYSYVTIVLVEKFQRGKRETSKCKLSFQGGLKLKPFLSCIISNYLISPSLRFPSSEKHDIYLTSLSEIISKISCPVPGFTFFSHLAVWYFLRLRELKRNVNVTWYFILSWGFYFLWTS